MAAGKGQRLRRIPRRGHAGGQGQALGHGAAGAVQPGVGRAQRPHGVVGRGALGLQVARKSQVDLVLVQPGGGQAAGHALLLQQAFGLLPLAALEGGVGEQQVESAGQRAFAFLFAARRRPGPHHRRGGKKDGVAAAHRHKDRPPCCFRLSRLQGGTLLLCRFLPGLCAPAAERRKRPRRRGKTKRPPGKAVWLDRRAALSKIVLGRAGLRRLPAAFLGRRYFILPIYTSQEYK